MKIYTVKSRLVDSIASRYLMAKRDAERHYANESMESFEELASEMAVAYMDLCTALGLASMQVVDSSGKKVQNVSVERFTGVTMLKIPEPLFHPNTRYSEEDLIEIDEQGYQAMRSLALKALGLGAGDKPETRQKDVKSIKQKLGPSNRWLTKPKEQGTGNRT